MSEKFCVTGDWVGHRPFHFPMNETYLRMPGGGGLGDLICFLGAAGIYAKLHPAERVFTNVLPEVIERYDPPVLDYHDCGHVAPLEVFEGQHRTKHQSPLRNYVGTFLSSMGEAINEPPGMELPRLEPAAGLATGSYIALQPYSGAARNPERRDQFVQALVDSCRNFAPNHPVVCVGHPSTTRSISKVHYEHLSGPVGMLQVIQHAALVLTPRSASAHIAAAFRVPGFLWLPDDGENWHLDYPHWITRRVSIGADWETTGSDLCSFLRSLQIPIPD
jgi:hypothetical protein